VAAYDSPGLAGIVTFASIFPGLLVSPIAGALLDRHGRVRLIVVDYAVALASLALIGGLALAGLLVSVLVFGRMDTRGREWRMIVVPLFLSAGAVALILPAVGAGGVEVGLRAGLVFLAAHSLAIGLLQGPLDIGLFTVRQRRTDPAWMGRAFAVSMAVNFMGFPVGAAAAGAIAAVSLPAAVGLGVVACLVGGVLAAVLIPRR